MGRRWPAWGAGCRRRPSPSATSTSTVPCTASSSGTRCSATDGWTRTRTRTTTGSTASSTSTSTWPRSSHQRCPCVWQATGCTNDADLGSRTLPGVIDLRSDTVTRPCDAMRRAMAEAEVGDDQFGEDPSINELQERVADLLGKEAALLLPTGTMANQVGLRTLTRPGDDVVVAAGAHMVWSETGAGAANSGVQFTERGGSRGWFDRDEFLAARKPRGHELLPPTTLVCFEDTHNRAGGVVVPQEMIESVCGAARTEGVTTFLDGARLWNAAVALDVEPARLAAPFDVVWVAFSKGLGAPG